MIIKNSVINEIEVRGVDAKIDIAVHEDNCILIEVDNDRVPIKANKRCLVIGENKNSEIFISNGNLSVSMKRCVSNVVICNGNIVFGGDVFINGKKVSDEELTPAEKVNVKIKVPFNQIKHLNSSFVTNWIVNKISKKLRIDTSGISEFLVKDIDNLEIVTSGQTKLIVSGVNNLEIDSSGQTNAEINSHMIESFEVDLSGQSSIDVNSNIENLEADLSGMSNLVIRGDVEDLEADLSGMSKLNIYGKVEKSECNSGTMSSVSVSYTHLRRRRCH